MITDITSIIYIKPITAIKTGILHISAYDATNPPSAKDPVSPINTLAGYALNIKNPIRLPITAPVTGVTLNSALSPISMKNIATIIVTDEQSPSSPSVKFTPLSVPSITNSAKGIQIMPSFNTTPVSNEPVNGISTP